MDNRNILVITANRITNNIKRNNIENQFGNKSDKSCIKTINIKDNTLNNNTTNKVINPNVSKISKSKIPLR